MTLPEDKNKLSHLPGYVKLFFLLSVVILTVFSLKVASPLISPLLAAFVISIILRPLSAGFEKIRIPRVISAGLSIIVLGLILCVIVAFFSRQIANIEAHFPSIQSRIHVLFLSLQTRLSTVYHVSSDTFTTYVNDALASVLKGLQSLAGHLVTITVGFAAGLLLFFISLYFFLYYRSFLFVFVLKLFEKNEHAFVIKKIVEIDETIKKYIGGYSFVMMIVAILNSGGLALVGLDNAVLFGVFGAVLTLVPFIGILIGSLIPAFYALLTMGSWWHAFFVILVFSAVQFLEGNIITPNIVGGKMNINPFAAILGLFVAGWILGPLGFILVLPLLGVIKILCDDCDSLKPVSFLLGNPSPSLKSGQKKNKQ